MKARLIDDGSKIVKLLCADGTIIDADRDNIGMFACNFRDALTFSGADGNWAEHSMDMAVYPGRTLAYVAEDFSLVIVEPDFFSFLFAKYTDETYIGLVDYAKKVNKSEQIIKVLCRDGRIPGAIKIGGRWMIPDNAPYPIAPSRQHGRIMTLK